MQKWWLRARFAIQQVMFPLICLQFIRTLLLPSGLDVFILFFLFIVYLGFLFDFY